MQLHQVGVRPGVGLHGSCRKRTHHLRPGTCNFLVESLRYTRILAAVGHDLQQPGDADFPTSVGIQPTKLSICSGKVATQLVPAPQPPSSSRAHGSQLRGGTLVDGVCAHLHRHPLNGGEQTLPVTHLQEAVQVSPVHRAWSLGRSTGTCPFQHSTGFISSQISFIERQGFAPVPHFFSHQALIFRRRPPGAQFDEAVEPICLLQPRVHLQKERNLRGFEAGGV